VALGASAGGLQALSAILADLPADFPAPLVVVLHLSPSFTSRLPEILARQTSLRVKAAQEGDLLYAGWIYIAPPARHLVVLTEGILSLTETEKVHYCRPSVDVLFQSVAASFGERAIAVVLTGADGDGAAGILAIRAAGGVTIAQDEGSSQNAGMPRAAAETGAVDYVLPLKAIAPALVDLVHADLVHADLGHTDLVQHSNTTAAFLNSSHSSLNSSRHAAAALETAQAAQASAEGASNALMVSERQYRRLFEAARDGILLLDSVHGRITDANPFMTELLGYSHDELLGRELWEIGLLADKTASRKAFRRLKQEKHIRYENLPLENRWGERREVEFVSNLYREDGHTVIQCNIRDISERKRVEADLVAAAAKHAHQDAVLEERTRMARELHDTLAQGFAGIATQLEAAEAALANVPPADPSGSLAACQDQLAFCQAQLGKVQSRIDKARDLARESLTEARRSVTALRLPALEADPLSEALTRFLTQRVLGTSAKSRYVLEGVPHALPTETEHFLLRIGQEAIVNAVEHAQAQEIDVVLCFEQGQVRLSVRDDGIGFDPHLPAVGRFGIIGMKERAEKVHGTLTIASHPGQGTRIDLSVPIPLEAQI
jgi:two-component system chemotaxis response regulator CheB